MNFTVGKYNFSQMRVILCIIIVAVGAYFIIQKTSKKYSKATGYITNNNNNNTQQIIYMVNDKQYTKIVNYTSRRKSLRSYPLYPHGKCTIYYDIKNPNEYTVNIGPRSSKNVIMSIIFILGMGLGVLFYKNPPITVTTN